MKYVITLSTYEVIEMHFISTLDVSWIFLMLDCTVGWLNGFNVGLELELLRGLLPTAWELLLKATQRYAITILILYRRNGSSTLVAQRSIREIKH